MKSLVNWFLLANSLFLFLVTVVLAAMLPREFQTGGVGTAILCGTLVMAVLSWAIIIESTERGYKSSIARETIQILEDSRLAIIDQIKERKRPLSVDELTEAFYLPSEHPLRICFDVDGVLAAGGKPYEDCIPIPEGVAVLKALHRAGHRIIIQTARYMREYSGNIPLAYETGSAELWDWLTNNQIPFHEIYMGKASSDIFIDDRGCRVATPGDWKQALPILRSLISSALPEETEKV